MARFIAFVCLLFAVTCAAAPEFNQFDSIEVVDNTYLAANPDAELIELQAENSPFAKSLYTFGKRGEGDRIISQYNESYNYGSARDIRRYMTYPQYGVGSIISYIEVVLEYNSNVGKIYIVDGGIGHRSIKLVIEANGITHYSASSTLWGF